MIQLNNVSKQYEEGKYAVNHLNLEIKDGEIFGFLGPNGAGKSTTLKMMTGITSLTEGNIVINNFDITKEPLNAKKQFAFVPDSPDMFLRLKGIEYLNFMGDIYQVDSNTRKERIELFTKRLGMEDALNNQIQSYSHGMRQKIILIGALIHNPDVWILDEPLTGLDPKSAFELKEMMHEHTRQNKTVLFSTHVLDVAEKICDRVGIIDRGKLLFVGTIEEMKKHFSNNKSLEEMFLELTNDNE